MRPQVRTPVRASSLLSVFGSRAPARRLNGAGTEDQKRVHPVETDRLRVVRWYGRYSRVIERRTVPTYQEFVRRMMAIHRVVPTSIGAMPMCSCGSVARMCPVLNAAHDLLGHQVPWE